MFAENAQREHKLLSQSARCDSDHSAKAAALPRLAFVGYPEWLPFARAIPCLSRHMSDRHV